MSLCRALVPAVLLTATVAVVTAGCTPGGPAATAASSTVPQAAAATPTAPLTSTPTPTFAPRATFTPTPVTAASGAASGAAPTGSFVLPPETKVYFAEAGDINGTLDYRPACASGCQLSGDSTAYLYTMTWRTWSTVKAVGTGTEKLNDCDPNCAGGHVYAVPVTVTFTDPVEGGCTAAHTGMVWTRASFTWPDGLPAALSGRNAPLNPFTYPGLAHPNCG